MDANSDTEIGGGPRLLLQREPKARLDTQMLTRARWLMTLTTTITKHITITITKRTAVVIKIIATRLTLTI